MARGRRCVCGVCEARQRGVSYEEYIDEHLLQMHDRIRCHGYTFTGVFGGRLPWVYSTGLLDTFGYPELTIIGLPLEEAYELIGAWADLIKGCVHPRVGRLDDAAGFPVRFIEVDPRHCDSDASWFCDWHRYHWFLGRSTFPLRVLQLVYSDDSGRFPGDEGYALGDQQPLLDR